MPIYEYTCKKCLSNFDKLVRSMSEAEKVPCPQCGSTQTARALSVFAVGAETAKSSPSPCERCNGTGPCPMGME